MSSTITTNYNNSYKIWNIFLTVSAVSVSVSAKLSAICGIGSIFVGKYLGTGIGKNLGIGAAMYVVKRTLIYQQKKN